MVLFTGDEIETRRALKGLKRGSKGVVIEKYGLIRGKMMYLVVFGFGDVRGLFYNEIKTTGKSANVSKQDLLGVGFGKTLSIT